MTALAAVGESAAPFASALVLVDVTPRLETGGTERIKAFMTARPEGFASLDEVADAVAAYLPGRPRPHDMTGLARNVRLGEDGRYRWHWDPRFLGAGRQDLVQRERPATAARAVGVPTLLVRGVLSDVVSEQGVAEFLGLIPHARHADVEGAGHMVAGDRNDAFSDAIFVFLDDVL
jgi:non-heme chloroperoxidase